MGINYNYPLVFISTCAEFLKGDIKQEHSIVTNKTAQYNNRPSHLPAAIHFKNYNGRLVELFRSIKLRCKTRLLASEDRKCKFKMNWTAVKPLTGTGILFNVNN